VTLPPNNQPMWIAPPTRLELTTTDVHVWRVHEEISPDRIAELKRTLSQQERDRAAAYRFEPDRKRFTICRGILRQLLGRYLNQPPEAVQFAEGTRSKPALLQACQTTPPLQFNLSHTKAVALFAFALGEPIGVDVEAIDAARNWESLAQRFLHPNEWQAISDLPTAERATAFYAWWTWKESYVKAKGIGLARGLATFEVSPISHMAGAARVNDPDDPDTARWILRSLNAGQQVAAALATTLGTAKISCFDWNPS
jgi:4'-phosphopantetheinyl transferase